MSLAINFDTLEYSKKLQAAGIDIKQADALATAQREVFIDFINSKELSTKTDIKDVKNEINNLRTELKTEINDLRTELKTEINDLRTELKTEINDLRTELKTEINDLRKDTEANFDKMRKETEANFDKMRKETEVQNIGLRLDMQKMEIRLLKWQIGVAIALIAIMAKGFGWLGF